jgi:hypothetical protein
MTYSVVLMNSNYLFSNDTVFFSDDDFCLIPLYSMVLIPQVFCYFRLGYLSHLCLAFMLSNSGMK